MRTIPSHTSAERLARSLLAPLGDRWRHTQGVAAEATRLTPAVPEEDRRLLVVAGWCHDIGYAPETAETGFHALDGARYLAANGYPERLCALVAHHSAALAEAEECGLVAELAEWPREETPLADALWTADMTTGPARQRLTYQERLAEILDRYDEESVVARAMALTRGQIEGAIARTRARLSQR